jgi:hypothetical protein
MVLGEWDRTDHLSGITGATWMGSGWTNKRNQGPWLDEAAEYLHSHSRSLELGVHGLCHEFWHEGKMERSEFHDRHGTMRAAQVVRSHLDAFAVILEHNGFSEFPRLFFPPALNHSFGNKQESMQAILRHYGIRYVVTRFSRARRFAPPRHARITWECGVGLLERGRSPVPWNMPASPPHWDFSGPILPLHWGNLLHPDPERSNDIIDGWADMLLAGTAGPERMLARNFAACWRQAAIFYYGKLSLDDASSIVLDLSALPQDMPNSNGPFCLRVQGNHSTSIRTQDARIVADRHDGMNMQTLQLLPKNNVTRIRLIFS